MTKELTPCPFCGVSMHIESNRDWHRLIGDHDEKCVFMDRETMTVSARDDQMAVMIEDWNTRATLSPAHIEDGEEVEVVGYRSGTSGHIYAEGYGLEKPEPLMTVAQHQRMTAALVARNEWLEQVAVEAAETEKHALQVADAYRNGSAALSAPPAAGVPIGMACKINGYWEAQLFAGHGCIDRQSLYAHPLPPADVPPGLAHRLLKAYDHGDTGAIEAAIEDIRTMLATAPTPPASEQAGELERLRGALDRIARIPGDSVDYHPSHMSRIARAAVGLCSATPPASEQQRAVVMPEGKLLVSAEPLRKVLFALLGAPHHIRELQATRTPTDLFTDNPINVLIAELNAAQGGDA